MQPQTDTQEYDNIRIKPRDVARVFFQEDSAGRITAMCGLRLQNHLENVALLARHWDFNRAFGIISTDVEAAATIGLDLPVITTDRRSWLIRAAERHDEGKPGRFKIVPPGQGMNRSIHFLYSFSGHRFDVEDDHPYIQQLIRLHHSFSVEDVTASQAYLLARHNIPEVAEAAPYFPLDLYALEMCDQIEAEASTHVFGDLDERQRVFMEFEVYPDHQNNDQPIGKSTQLRIFPYPFDSNEVKFTFEAFVVSVPSDAEMDGQSLKKRLLYEPVASDVAREVVLCPLE